MTFSRIGMISQNQNQPNLSEGGAQPGGTELILSDGDTSKIAARLSQHNPADMDKKAVSLAQSCGVGLEVKFKTVFRDGQMFDVAKGCEVVGTDEQRQAALSKLLIFQTPAPKRTIEEWLAELSVLTAGRGADGLSAELLVSVYSSRLGAYPADVVKFALLKHPWKWFPAWAELEAICRAKAGAREHMIAELRKPQPEKEREYVAPTKEERERMQQMIAEKFPEAPQEWRDAALRELDKPDYLRR